MRHDLDADLITNAVRALVEHVSTRRSRDITVETINGDNAATSPLSPTFQAAGLRLTTAGLRHYASFARGPSAR